MVWIHLHLLTHPLMMGLSYRFHSGGLSVPSLTQGCGLVCGHLEINPEFPLEGLMLKLRLQYLAT